jgi:hypothetical protein
VVLLPVQEPGAGEIDAQSQRRDRKRLLEMDGHGMEQPQDRLIADPERDEPQDDGAGKCRQFAELAGTERKARIVRMPAGKQIGEARDRQRGDVCRHVPTVGDERDRAEQRAADDFDDHHHRGQGHDAPGAPLMLLVTEAEKGVAVRPGGNGLRMHAAPRCTLLPAKLEITRAPRKTGGGRLRVNAAVTIYPADFAWEVLVSHRLRGQPWTRARLLSCVPAVRQPPRRALPHATADGGDQPA